MNDPHASTTSAEKDSTASEAEIETRTRDLRRMRSLATLLLVAMALIFVATSFAQKTWPALAYVRAFAEAAMVGACADWFAVVALFRRPLGLPIPHTAIVPRNKARIGAALGRFIANHFLTLHALARRLYRVEAAGYVADWLSAPGHARALAEQTSQFLPQAFEALPQDELVDVLANAAVRGLEALPVTTAASRLLALVWARGETQALLDRGVAFLEGLLVRNKELIREKVSEKTSRLIPKWIDGLLAGRLIEGVQSTLADMRKPDHPWRLDLKREIERLIHDLEDKPEMRAWGETLKRDLIAHPAFAVELRKAAEGLRNQVDVNLRTKKQSIADAIEYALLAAARLLHEDASMRAKINRWTRRAVLSALLPRRAEIGAYISTVMTNWDTTTLVTRLELHVGRDLQYIRINGTLVGGLVGEVIFIVSKFFPSSG